MVKLSMNEYGIVRSYAIGKGVELMNLKRAREIRRAFVLHEKQVYALELNSRGEAVGIAVDSHIDEAFRKAAVYHEYMIESL